MDTLKMYRLLGITGAMLLVIVFLALTGAGSSATSARGPILTADQATVYTDDGVSQPPSGAAGPRGGGNCLFYDNFNGSAANWVSHSGTWTLDPNGWWTSPGIAGAWVSTSRIGDYGNLDFTTALWRDGCKSCANDVFIRGTPDPLTAGNVWNSYYAFRYGLTGLYSVSKRVSGGIDTALTGWTSSSAINNSSWNVLRVRANGPDLAFFINGIMVWSGTDSSLTSGRVGFGMYSDNTSGSRFYADYANLCLPSYALNLPVLMR